MRKLPYPLQLAAGSLFGQTIALAPEVLLIVARVATILAALCLAQAVVPMVLTAQVVRDNIPLRHWPAPLYWQPDLEDLHPSCGNAYPSGSADLHRHDAVPRSGYASRERVYRRVWVAVARRRDESDVPHSIEYHVLDTGNCHGVFVELYGSATGTLGLHHRVADGTEPAFGLDAQRSHGNGCGERDGCGCGNQWINRRLCQSCYGSRD
jgi:hypothetical protein